MRMEIGPVLLIVIGIVLLLYNLDVLPVGQIKKIVTTWWPLVLVAAGIIQMRKGK